MQANDHVWLVLWCLWMEEHRDVGGSCLGEETLCPELFHSMIISVKAKKT